MTTMNLNTLLRELTALPTEVEWVEFKCNNQNPEEMGEYLSALANAAALLRKDRAYIVWGIEDVTHKVVGTTFKPRQTKKGNEELKNWLGRLLQPRLDFRVHEFAHEGKLVVLFEVPAASHTPVRFSGEEFIRVGSYKKKLKDYPEKERALWAIFQKEDWSAQLLPGASLDDLKEPGRVKVRIIGKVMDEKYTRMLMNRSDLELADVILLDKVQKGRPLSDEEFRSLKAKRLIEGRRPNVFVSAEVAAATESKADYIKKRAFDKAHYKKMVAAYLEKFGEAKRKDVNKLLLGKLSDALNEKQKRVFIMNLLQEMRRERAIVPVGAQRGRGAKRGLHKPAAKGPAEPNIMQSE